MGGTSRWDKAQLSNLIQQGDPEADAVVARLFEEQALSGVQALINSLTRNRGVIPSDLPDYVKHYFDNLPVTDEELRKSRVGEVFFAQHGPEIMMVLCCASLPFDYGNALGVEVLSQTGFLSKQPNLRVAQTAQMIVDVLSPGGLSPHGFGVRSTQKVRLMHAAIRCMLLNDTKRPWDRQALGVPINQLHLLYTLMSFTQVVLAGLRRMKLNISPQDEQGYLETWSLVGRILGIHPDIIPLTVVEAEELTAALALEAQGTTSAGKQLTSALAGLIGDVLGPFAFLRFSLIRYFTGPSLAAMLGLPTNFISDWIVGGVAWVARAVDHFRTSSPGHQIAFRWLTLRLIQYLIDEQVGLPRRLFEIPTTIQDDWKTVPGRVT